MSWDNSFSNIGGYGMCDQGSVPDRGRICLCGLCPDWLWGPSTLCAGVKQQESEADRSVPFNAQV
jgi:hypothetical protein